MYYGDEIGMGDNFYLGDRDGVRTPMQWSPDRNGGFSRAKPQELFLPSIQDAVYGYEAVNVEAQSGASGSLLNWMRRTVRIRKRIRAFGRGKLTFLYPRNRKVLAYIRSHEDEDVLCVFNLSRSAQAAELDLSAFKGRVPVELEGGGAFPPLGELPYLLTLPPWGFFWFLLAHDAEMPDWHEPVTGIQPEFETIPCRSERLEAALTPEALWRLARGPLPEFLRLQRWYQPGDAEIERVEARPGPEIRSGLNLSIVELKTKGREPERYFLPLTALWGEEHLQFGSPTLSATIARLRKANRLGALVDACVEPDFAVTLAGAMRDEREARGGAVTLRATSEPSLTDLPCVAEARSLGADDTGVAIALDDAAVVKLYRRLETGHRAEVELARFLKAQGRFRNTPEYLGEATLAEDGRPPSTIAACFAYIRGQGEAWTAIVDALERALEDRAHIDGHGQVERALHDDFAYPLDLGEIIGRRIGEFHAALADPGEVWTFRGADATPADIARWSAQARVSVGRALAALATASEGPAREALLARGDDALEAASALAQRIETARKTRIHGDLRLARLLISEGDVYLTGFRGPSSGQEPTAALASPLEDVARLLTDIEDAAITAVARLRARGVAAPEAERYAWAWRDAAREAFFNGYAEGRGASSPEDSPLLRLLRLDAAFARLRHAAEHDRGVEEAARLAHDALEAAAPSGVGAEASGPGAGAPS
jgi:maltose alpha-D-glucosyltransferase/alpha-amylase